MPVGKQPSNIKLRIGRLNTTPQYIRNDHFFKKKSYKNIMPQEEYVCLKLNIDDAFHNYIFRHQTIPSQTLTERRQEIALIKKRAKKVAKVLRAKSEQFLYAPCNTPISLRDYLDLRKRLNNANPNVKSLIYRTFKNPAQASGDLKHHLDIFALKKDLKRGLSLLDHLAIMNTDVDNEKFNQFYKEQAITADPYLCELIDAVAKPWQIITGRSVTPVNSSKEGEKDTMDVKINYFSNFIINVLKDNTPNFNFPTTGAIVKASQHWLKIKKPVPLCRIKKRFIVLF